MSPQVAMFMNDRENEPLAKDLKMKTGFQIFMILFALSAPALGASLSCQPVGASHSSIKQHIFCGVPDQCVFQSQNDINGKPTNTPLSFDPTSATRTSAHYYNSAAKLSVILTTNPKGQAVLARVFTGTGLVATCQ